MNNKTDRQILREHFQTLETKLSFTEWMNKLSSAEEKRIIEAAKKQDTTSGENVEKAEDLVEKAEQLVESADRTLHEATEAAQHPQGASETEHPKDESSTDESDKIEQLSPERITGQQHNRRKTDGNGDDQHQGGQEEGHQGEHQEQVEEIDEELQEMEERFTDINEKLKEKDPDVAEAIGMMLEEVKGLHQRVKAIGEGGHAIHEVEEGKASKAKLAREIFETELEKKGKKGMVRKDIINQFLKIGLTPSGANTYYQNFRSEHGLVERR